MLKKTQFLRPLRLAVKKGLAYLLIDLRDPPKVIEISIFDYSAILKKIYYCYFAQKENKLFLQRYFLCGN